MIEMWQVIGGVVGGTLGTVAVYVKVLSGRLDKIETKVDRINGSLGKHAIRLALLEDKE